MPIVMVQLLEGRPAALKEKIARGVVKVFEQELHLGPSDTVVVFQDVKAVDWFANGNSLGKEKIRADEL